MEKPKRNFLDEAISDGEIASFGRLGSLIALVFSCLWISVLVWRVSKFEDLPELGIFIGACAAFISALYALSRGADVIEAVKSKNSLTAENAKDAERMALRG